MIPVIKTLSWPYDNLTLIGRILNGLNDYVNDPKSQPSMKEMAYAVDLGDMLYAKAIVDDEIPPDECADIISNFVTDRSFTPVGFIVDVVNNALLGLKDPEVGTKKIEKYEVTLLELDRRCRMFINGRRFIFYAQDIRFASDLLMSAIFSAKNTWKVQSFNLVETDGSLYNQMNALHTANPSLPMVPLY